MALTEAKPRVPILGINPEATISPNFEVDVEHNGVHFFEHYARNHGVEIPEMNPDDWNMILRGLNEDSVIVEFEDLLDLHKKGQSISYVNIMECAGNGRGDSAPGEPWTFRAFGRAEWTGIPLKHFLEHLDRTSRDLELGFAGWDQNVPFGDVRVPYERSLPISEAEEDDVIVAFEMNGEPIPPIYGGPVRVVTPGWYGMASYKRPRELSILEEPLVSPHQTERYIYDSGKPVSRMRPRSVIMGMSNGFKLSPGSIIEGIAWGANEIIRTEISLDGGETWENTVLGPRNWEGRHDRQIWRKQIRDVKPGEAVLLSRAIDSIGDAQPAKPRPSKFGYGRNDFFQQIIVGEVAA